MTTIKQAVESTKCRTGDADATTKSGAFWLACPPIKLRRWGGDGIGNNAPDMDAWLQLRHYRSGEVRAMVEIEGWHQNGSPKTTYHHVGIEDCETVEDVIVKLKAGVDGDYGRATIYSDNYAGDLTKAWSRWASQRPPRHPTKSASKPDSSRRPIVVGGFFEKSNAAH